MRIALTIAGSDSGGGAGIQADLKTFSALDLFGTSVITAITAQNTVGVTAVHEIPVEVIETQLDAVASDLRPDATKIGMLSSAVVVQVVAEGLHRHALIPVVLDPVMVAKSGARLLRSDAIDALERELIPLATVITPNIPEAEVLTGRTIHSEEDQVEAARDIVRLGAGAAVVKGGHLEGDAVDILWDGRSVYRFSAPRVQTQSTHGTGCTFSSAIASYLALGEPLPVAVERAKYYLTGALQHAPGLGRGHGPVQHGWMTRVDLNSVGVRMFTPAQLLLYAIVDPDLCRGRSPADVALAAAQGGATLVQVRADALSTLDLLHASQDVVNALRSLNVPVIINDRVDIALAVGAAGVHVGHVGAEDMPPDIARRLLGDAAVVGVSIATAEEARAALRLGASYVSLGPIFETSSKHDAGPAVGLDRIRSIRAVYPGPLCAIGGITADNAAAVIEAGADGVAVLGTIAGAEDPFAAARRLRASLH